MEYDQSFYCGQNMRYWAKKYSAAVPKDVTHLISASISGATICAAVLAINKADLFHTHVHPPKRLSHRGKRKEASGCRNFLPKLGKDMYKRPVFAFLDDFSDTGATFMGVYNYLDKNNLSQSLKYALLGIPGSVLPIKSVKIISVK
jgi:hypothetical protein